MKNLKASLFTLSLLFTFSINSQLNVKARKATERPAKQSPRLPRSHATRMASIEPERAERTNSACDRCQKEYNDLLAELNKVRMSKEFREGNPQAQERALHCETRTNEKLREFMDLATNGNSQAAAAA